MTAPSGILVLIIFRYGAAIVSSFGESDVTVPVFLVVVVFPEFLLDDEAESQAKTAF